ncbi:MAG TPA: AzlC family ABC transporter permease [Acidimicrobiia bacterium]
MVTDRAVIRRGIVDALPIYVPAIPFALVLGLAIVESEIGLFTGWSGSWLIYSGAGQLVLVSLLGTGAAVAAAMTASLVISARHLMYSAALAPSFQRQPTWFRWLGPYLLIDQLFALMTVKLDEEPDDFRTYYLAAGLTFWLLWQLTTLLGIVIGPVVPEEWNLAFAVPLLFIGLLVLGIDTSPKLVAAVVAAAVTFVLAGMPNRAGLLIGSVVGVIAGVVAGRIRP